MYVKKIYWELAKEMCGDTYKFGCLSIAYRNKMLELYKEDVQKAENSNLNVDLVGYDSGSGFLRIWSGQSSFECISIMVDIVQFKYSRSQSWKKSQKCKDDGCF